MMSKKANILILEDMRMTAEDISSCLEMNGYNITAITGSAQEAIDSAKADPPDLAILDIKVRGEMSGIDAAARICAEHEIPIIFLTAYTDPSTLSDAKMTRPVAFLTKPFRERELQIQVELALHNFNNGPQDIIIRENHQSMVIDAKEIRWIQADGSYIDIHSSKRDYRIAMNLRKFTELLPEGNSLMRIHRSYMVNAGLIEQYDAEGAWMGGKLIPVSRSYWKTFKAKMISEQIEQKR